MFAIAVATLSLVRIYGTATSTPPIYLWPVIESFSPEEFDCIKSLLDVQKIEQKCVKVVAGVVFQSIEVVCTKRTAHHVRALILADSTVHGYSKALGDPAKFMTTGVGPEPFGYPRLADKIY